MSSGIEDIASAFILKEEKRTAIKAFVDQKDVFVVLPTYVTYSVALIGCRSIQLGAEAFRLKQAP